MNYLNFLNDIKMTDEIYINSCNDNYLYYIEKLDDIIRL